MKNIEFYARGVAWSLMVSPMDKIQVAMTRASEFGAQSSDSRAATSFDPATFVKSLRRSKSMRTRILSADPAHLGIVHGLQGKGRRGLSASSASSGSMTILTPTLIVEGARSNDMKAARNAGARIVHEGFDGKVLLAVEQIDQLSGVIALLQKRDVGAVSPNFLRRFGRTPLSTTSRDWAHIKIGLKKAWAITKGSRDVSVAVLDEGVDTTHPDLRSSVVGQHDFIGDKGDSAMPDGNDAHGTACAGIIVARGSNAGGIAPKCSLLAARIAMDDGAGNWVFDDFATADAIDWAWRQGAAAISNSWGGGVPSDSIGRAFGRARTQGRGGKGSLVCIAAGNNQRPIDFPGSLPGYVTVGASNSNDERKTRTSTDGEPWGSGFGPTMWLLAPGVSINTTDISGAAGYEPGDYTATFNGTSSATPHVAGAAALMISANPNLSASDVRILLSKTARLIPGQTEWTAEEGHGRLDVAAAVAAAKAHA